MSKNKNEHGFFGKLIKVLMVIIFFVFGACLIALNTYLIVKRGDYTDLPIWVPIVNLVFGCLLLASPFFLSHKREGFNKVLRFIIAFIFVIIGICLIVIGSCALGFHYDVPLYISIINIVFGALLLTSPIFLKKEL